MVKCTSCGARWRAFQDRSEPERETPEDEMLVESPLKPRPEGDDLDVVGGPIVPKRKPEAKKKRSPLMVAGVGLGVVLALGLGAAVVFRQQVADLVPATAPVFAAIGLPVNTLGLVIDVDKPKAMLQAGRPVLSVTGTIRNVRKASIEAPPIRFHLLDKAGKPVASLLVQPLNAKVPPGATRYFAVSFPDPPVGATQLDVAFEPAPEGAAHVAEAGHAAPASPAGPEPVEAKALSPDSPDALTQHE